MEKDQIYNCEDKDLGAMLQRLFAEGHDEVVVQHPTDGPVTVTKKDYKKYLREIARVQSLSPAKRVTENARHRNLKNMKQIRFRTAMITAPVYVVDIDDESNFGKDIHGEEIPMKGMVFLPVAQYLKGMEPKEKEIGCFVDEYDEKRQPIRITAR